METFSALLAICAGNSPVTGEFPTQRPDTTRSFDVFFDLRPNERLSKQSWGWWLETLSGSLWRHRNVCFCCIPCHATQAPKALTRWTHYPQCFFSLSYLSIIHKKGVGWGWGKEIWFHRIQGMSHYINQCWCSFRTHIYITLWSAKWHTTP